MSGRRARKSATTVARGAGARDRQEAKRERRLARQQQEAAERNRVLRRRRAVRVGVAIGAIAVVAGAASLALGRDPELDGVQRPPSQGRGHVVAPTYDSATPTSGKHLAQAPRCTSFTEPLEPGLAVHALEHGAVVLWYDTSREELRTELEDLLANWPSHVLISAHANPGAPIVATAWNRRAEYQRADARVEEFVKTYRNRGPEREPCEA